MATTWKISVGVDLDTLNPNGRTLTISNLPSGVVALDAGYSEVTNTLVVLGKNGNLYYFDAELNLLKTVESTKPSTGSLYSLTVSGHYLYVNGNGNGMKGVGLRVFIPGLGPINLDYGIPLTNTAGADRKNGFFTFGMGEMF